MTQSASYGLNPRTNPNACYPRGNKLESIEKWSKRDLWRRVFVPYDYDGFALDTTSSLQLEAISDEAHIALVWVQEIHRPIFRLFAVIAKRSRELEFQSPLVWDQQVWRSLGSRCLVVSGQFIEMLSHGGNKLWLAVRTHSCSKLLERDPTLINAYQSITNISDKLTEIYRHGQLNDSG